MTLVAVFTILVAGGLLLATGIALFRRSSEVVRPSASLFGLAAARRGSAARHESVQLQPGVSAEDDVLAKSAIR